MNGSTSRTPDQPPVTHAELERLVAEYRHVLEEHRRAHAHSTARRRFEHRLLAISNRFERLLTRMPADPETRARWRTRLHHGTPAPSESELRPAQPAPVAGRRPDRDRHPWPRRPAAA